MAYLRLIAVLVVFHTIYSVQPVELSHAVETNNRSKLAQTSRKVCALGKSCVTFCCKYHDENCHDQQYFNLTKLAEAKNVQPKFQILMGEPNCEIDENGNKRMGLNEDPWNLDIVFFVKLMK
jgi:hypothetical protein